MRLDHLLSKEHTARSRGSSSRSGSSHVEHWLVGTRVISRPSRRTFGFAKRAPPRAPSRLTSLFRFEGVAGRASARPATSQGSAAPHLVARWERCRVPVRPSHDACIVGRAVSHCPLRTAERARASLYVSKKKNSQAMKSQRWMPWRQMPMKDVDGCEKPRGAAYQASIRGYPNGETRQGSCLVTPA